MLDWILAPFKRKYRTEEEFNADCIDKYECPYCGSSNLDSFFWFTHWVINCHNCKGRWNVETINGRNSASLSHLPEVEDDNRTNLYDD